MAMCSLRAGRFDWHFYKSFVSLHDQLLLSHICRLNQYWIDQYKKQEYNLHLRLNMGPFGASACDFMPLFTGWLSLNGRALENKCEFISKNMYIYIFFLWYWLLISVTWCLVKKNNSRFKFYISAFGCLVRKICINIYIYDVHYDIWYVSRIVSWSLMVWMV